MTLLRRFRGRFDLSEDFVYGVLTSDESEVVGGTGLHTRDGPQTRDTQVADVPAMRGRAQRSTPPRAPDGLGPRCDSAGQHTLRASPAARHVDEVTP